MVLIQRQSQFYIRRLAVPAWGQPYCKEVRLWCPSSMGTFAAHCCATEAAGPSIPGYATCAVGLSVPVAFPRPTVPAKPMYGLRGACPAAAGAAPLPLVAATPTEGGVARPCRCDALVAADGEVELAGAPVLCAMGRHVVDAGGVDETLATEDGGVPTLKGGVDTGPCCSCGGTEEVRCRIEECVCGGFTTGPPWVASSGTAIQALDAAAMLPGGGGGVPAAEAAGTPFPLRAARWPTLRLLFTLVIHELFRDAKSARRWSSDGAPVLELPPDCVSWTEATSSVDDSAMLCPMLSNCDESAPVEVSPSQLSSRTGQRLSCTALSCASEELPPSSPGGRKPPGLAWLRGDGGLELERCEPDAKRPSSESSCTAGSAPDELEERMPRDRSDREEPITGKERSEKDMDKDAGRDAVLPYCRSGVIGGDVR